MVEAVRAERDRPNVTGLQPENTLIVDVDVHVNESPAALAPYCDMPWRRALEALTDVPPRYLDIPGFSPGGGTYLAPFPGGHDATREVGSPQQMRDELDELHIDLGILFPDHFLKLAVLPQAAYASALARAYNAWLLDNWCTGGNGLLACIIAAPQDPEGAAREIERYAKEPSVVGVYLPSAGIEPLWGHHRYDPILQAAQDADLPLLLHSVTVVHPAFPCQLHQFESEIARHTLGHTFSMIANLVNLVTKGVPVRFPRLRVGFTEAGVSWVPFVMNRLDKEYVERRREVPFLEDRPSKYVRKYYFSTQPIEEPEDPADLVTTIRLYGGEDTTMFASDWPHHDFDHPRKVMQMLGSDPDLTRKVMGENALRFFRIDEKGNRAP